MRGFYLFFLSIILVSSAKAQAEYGVAIPYAEKFQGTKTASGDRYDQDKLTASHRTLPMRTKVRITNLKNQQSIVAVINDTGPYVKGCISNVSLRVARAINLPKSGGKVKVEVVGTAKPKPAIPAVVKPKKKEEPVVVAKPPVVKPEVKPEKREVLYKVQVHEVTQQSFGVQIGKFDRYEKMLEKVADIQANHFKNILIFNQINVDGSHSYRLIIGPFEDEQIAISYKENAKKKGIDGFVVNLAKL